MDVASWEYRNHSVIFHQPIPCTALQSAGIGTAEFSDGKRRYHIDNGEVASSACGVRSGESVDILECHITNSIIGIGKEYMCV